MGKNTTVLQPLLVENLFQSQGVFLKLELIAGENGLQRKIKRPEAHRPGLSLCGFLKEFEPARALVFGNVELHYLKDLSSPLRAERLAAILTEEVPFVVVAGKYRPPTELISLCKEKNIPLFITPLPTMELLGELSTHLLDAFAPSITCHGTFIEAFGVGLLIQGHSSIGKSEAALGMIDRGHRLISDDIVRLRRRKGNILEGSGPELTRHMMEIRGIGIINVAHLYGAVCVRDTKSLDVIVTLEAWSDEAFYDRMGLDERTLELLGVQVPHHVLPVKPGRDVALLLETIVLNFRLKLMGYHSAKEFNAKLLETISEKVRKKRR